jgi:long-chain acyl-CoA synthetase
MAVQRAVADKWKRVTGMTLVEAYGLTEASPAVTINPVDLADFNGAIGLPIPNTEVAIRDEGGHELSPGDIGELCVRGPQVMKGYWKRPEETIKVMTADGFLRTGDLAKLDPDGFVRVVDRKKDMINVSGLKLYPNEIEDIAALCPGVLEAGAVGVPDATSGETVRLVVVRTDPELTADKLIAHFRKHLAGYKVPRQIEFRSSLPKSPIGKVLRRALRDDASKQPPTST